jgi:replicative DNA helicase
MDDFNAQGQGKQNGGQRNFGKSNKSNTNDMSSFVFGKVPPQAASLEEAVLGALMLDKDALPAVLDILRADSFYSDAHQAIYKAVLELFRNSKPIDLLTVTEELKKMAALETIGGAYYLVELTNRVASAANIEYHARIIAQKHIQRELIKVSTAIIRDAYEDTTDVFDLMDKAEQSLFAITETNLSRSFEGMNSLASKLLKQIETLSQKGDGLTGVPTGFTDLDRMTSGWQPSDLVIIAARPSMGKTAFVLSLARNAAMDFGKGVAMFSLEMSNLQLVQRLVSMEAEIPSSKLRNGQLESHEWQQLHVAIEKMSKAPIYIDDTPGINIFELRAKCRRLKAQHDIQLIIIDYLQLMSGGGEGNRGGNREQEISQISRALKGLAKELSVPVIALSQLSRAVETRGGSKKPQLSDLRESGAIEQDADIVGFIYRPEYYQILEDESGNSTKGMADILISKHRNGALGEVRLRFVGEFSKFTDADNTTFADLAMDFNAPAANIITRPSRMNDDTKEDIPF